MNAMRKGSKQLFLFVTCVSLLSFTLIGCGGGGGGSDSSGASNDTGFQYATYQDTDADGDPTDNFSVDYPKSWTSMADPDLGVPGVLWASVDENALGFQTNANVVLERTSLSFSEYKQATLDNLPALVPGFSLQSSRSLVTTTGIQAYVMIYDELSSGTLLRVEQSMYYDDLNAEVFILTLGAQRSSFSSYAEAFDYMVSSFELR